MADADRRLLFVHAHPDDESINNGATMAKYAAAGGHVALVTCTLGEEGEVLVDELAHLAADKDDQLGKYRVGELAAAMDALGVTDYRFLGGAGRYRDSGMMGEPANERPDCFWQAPVDEAAVYLVQTIREVRPPVLVTYDENGGYGHPDHIQAHRVAMRAFELAAEPDFRRDLGEPWQVAKVYWNAIADSSIRQAILALRQAGDTTTFQGIDPEGDIPYAVPDDLVTTEIDGAEFAEAKLAALRAHATQIKVDGPFFALSNNLGSEVMSHEQYRLAHGRRGPGSGAAGREADLFAGLSA